MKIRTTTPFLGLVLLVTAAMNSAIAETSTPSNAFQMDIGYFLSDQKADVKLDARSKIEGSDVSLEEDLGYKSDKDVGRIEFQWRILPRHRLMTGFFEFNRNGYAVLDRELTILGNQYKIDEEVDSRSSNTIYELGYMYSFVQTETVEVSGTLGFHVLNTEFEIEVTNPIRGSTLKRKADATGPLPLAGIDLSWNIRPKLILNLRAQYFSLNFNEIDSNLTNLRAGMEYRFTKTVGIGFAYHEFDLDISIDKNNYFGEFDWGYDGFQGYITLRF